ncbi:FAD-linked oxidase C-terminal domain-containing protein [Nocardia sp. XZ_19_385]
MTGEHGIGTLTAEWLTRELDPAGIFNPGKVIAAAHA